MVRAAASQAGAIGAAGNTIDQACMPVQREQAALGAPLQMAPVPEALFHWHLIQPVAGQRGLAVAPGAVSQLDAAVSEKVLTLAERAFQGVGLRSKFGRLVAGILAGLVGCLYLEG